MADHYEILGVARTANAAEVRKAYAKLARERHPDRFADPVEKERAQEFFKDATAAFNALTNEKARREYDAQIERAKATTPDEHAKLAFDDAQARAQAGDTVGAAELLRQAVYHQPQSPQYRIALGRALVRDLRTAREGIQILEEAGRADPQNAGIFFDLAVALRAQGLGLRARKAAEAAAALAPGDAAIARLLGELRAPEPEPPKQGGLGGFFRRKA